MTRFELLILRYRKRPLYQLSHNHRFDFFCSVNFALTLNSLDTLSYESLSECVFFKKWTKPGLLLFLFSFFSHDKYSTNTINEKAQMACLGLKPGAVGWQVQTNPLSYGGTPERMCLMEALQQWLRVSAKTTLFYHRLGQTFISFSDAFVIVDYFFSLGGIPYNYSNLIFTYLCMNRMVCYLPLN